LHAELSELNTLQLPSCNLTVGLLKQQNNLVGKSIWCSRKQQYGQLTVL